MMNKAQADVAYGFATITRRDPDYHAVTLMNNVLGQYGIGGRLGDSIRERQGMAYYAFSSFDGNVGEGPLVIRAGVAPENVDRTIASIDEEVRTHRRGTASRHGACRREALPDWVDAAERSRPTRALRRFSTTTEFFGLGLDYDRRVPALLDAVTLDEVHAATRRVLDPATCVDRDRGAGPSAGASGPVQSGVTRAVFFDVDFTLIYPGPTFRGEGYQQFCARHGIAVDRVAVRGRGRLPRPRARRSAATTYTKRRSFIDTRRDHHRGMGGAGPGVKACAAEIYDEWAACHHFELYDDVPAALAINRGAKHPHRPDLEQPPLPRLVSEPLRARGPDHRGRVLVGARLHEAAPEYLRSRAAPD